MLLYQYFFSSFCLHPFFCDFTSSMSHPGRITHSTLTHALVQVKLYTVIPAVADLLIMVYSKDSNLYHEKRYVVLRFSIQYNNIVL